MISNFKTLGEWFSESFQPLEKTYDYEDIQEKQSRNYASILDDIRQPFSALTDLIYGLGFAVLMLVPQIFNFIGWLITLPVAIFLDPAKVWKDITNFFEENTLFQIISLNLVILITTPFAWLIRIPGRLIATALDSDPPPPPAFEKAEYDQYGPGFPPPPYHDHSSAAAGSWAAAQTLRDGYEPTHARDYLSFYPRPANRGADADSTHSEHRDAADQGHSGRSTPVRRV